MCPTPECLCKLPEARIMHRFFNLFNKVFTVHEERVIEAKAQIPDIDPKMP